MDKVIVKVKNVKTSIYGTRVYGYAGSGYFPKTEVNFFVVDGEDGKTYIMNTTKVVKDGDTIKASVKGENEYRGVHQTVLTRISLI